MTRLSNGYSGAYKYKKKAIELTEKKGFGVSPYYPNRKAFYIATP